jgi:hypothetical protein
MGIVGAYLGISPYIGLIYGRYFQFRYLKWPLILECSFFGGKNYRILNLTSWGIGFL